MRLLILSCLLSIQVFAIEKIWTGRSASGQSQYLVLHKEGARYQLDYIVAEPGRLQELQHTRYFESEEEALAYVERNRAQLIHVTPFRLFGVAETQTQIPELSSSTHLWEVNHQWDSHWEELYADWVEESIDKDFFVRHALKTDCADIVFVARWIFARNNGLPVANRLAGSGVLMTHETMKRSWRNLATHSDWSQDQRFRAALNYLMVHTYTHSLMRDSYPIEITREAFLPGVHHLALSGYSGHSMLVRRVSVDSELETPLLVTYSTVPRMVRELSETGFWDSEQPEKGVGGFLRFRWPVRSRSSWVLKRASAMPDYSLEQYSPDFMLGDRGFAEAVLLRLNPDLDFRGRVRDGIQSLLQQLEDRVQLVEDGFEECRLRDCSEGTSAYDDWSTPSRDRRLGTLFSQVGSLVERLSESIWEISEMWNTALSEEKIDLGDRSLSLGYLYWIWEAKLFSSHPEDEVARRWASKPDFLLDAYTRGLGQALDSRLDGDLFENDEALRDQIKTLMKIQGYMDEESRQRLSALSGEVLLEAAGRNLSLDEWFSRISNFVSFGGASEEMLWGEANGDYRRFDSYGSGIYVQVSKNGMVYVSRDKVHELQDPQGRTTLRFDHQVGTSVSFDESSGMLLVTRSGDERFYYKVLSPEGKIVKEDEVAIDSGHYAYAYWSDHKMLRLKRGQGLELFDFNVPGGRALGRFAFSLSAGPFDLAQEQASGKQWMLFYDEQEKKWQKTESLLPRVSVYDALTVLGTDQGSSRILAQLHEECDHNNCPARVFSLSGDFSSLSWHPELDSILSNCSVNYVSARLEQLLCSNYGSDSLPTHHMLEFNRDLSLREKRVFREAHGHHLSGYGKTLLAMEDEGYLPVKLWMEKNNKLEEVPTARAGKALKVVIGDYLLYKADSDGSYELYRIGENSSPVLTSSHIVALGGGFIAAEINEESRDYLLYDLRETQALPSPVGNFRARGDAHLESWDVAFDLRRDNVAIGVSHGMEETFYMVRRR